MMERSIMFLRIKVCSSVKFANRSSAGIALAELLKPLSVRGDVIVIGLARGGVEVAKAIAAGLSYPLDVLVIKKIGSPHNAELAVGALAPDRVAIINWKLAHRVGADELYINGELDRLSHEIDKKTALYRKGKKPLKLDGKTVIFVDDGAATGVSLETAILWGRKKRARRIIAAVPVAPADTAVKIRPEVDTFIAAEMPEDMRAVSEFYEQFPQLTDAEVVQLLA